MSETLLEEGKVLVGSFTGPASLGHKLDRAMLQLTIRDGSDTAQLTRQEAMELSAVLNRWIEDTGSLI